MQGKQLHHARPQPTRSFKVGLLAFRQVGKPRLPLVLFQLAVMRAPDDTS
jgi:hypothetical protein